MWFTPDVEPRQTCLQHLERAPEVQEHKIIAASTVEDGVLAGVHRHLLEHTLTMVREEMIAMAELRARTAPLRTRRTEPESWGSAPHSPVVVQLHPGAAEGYRRMAETLHLAIGTTPARTCVGNRPR